MGCHLKQYTTVTVRDFSELTGAAVFASEICGSVAHYAVQPGGFPAQGGSHNLHVAQNPKPRIIRSSHGKSTHSRQVFQGIVLF